MCLKTCASYTKNHHVPVNVLYCATGCDPFETKIWGVIRLYQLHVIRYRIWCVLRCRPRRQRQSAEQPDGGRAAMAEDHDRGVCLFAVDRKNFH